MSYPAGSHGNQEENGELTLRTLAECRATKIFCSPVKPQEVLQDPYWEGAIWGSCSATKSLGRGRSHKGTFPGAVWAWPDLEGVSPGGAARWGLEYAFSRVGVEHYSGRKWRNKDYQGLLGAPLYCVPGGFTGQAMYLDIKGAFWNLYRRLPIVLVRLDNGTIKYAGAVTHEQALPQGWGEHKLVRNALPGLWRAGQLARVRGGKLVYQEIEYTPFRSLAHWLVLREVLDWIAYHAVRVFKASYWHTDGGIWVHPWLSAGWEFVSWLWETTGLIAELDQEGYCTCQGVGVYEFTAFPQPTTCARPGGHDGIKASLPPPPVWLQLCKVR